MRDLNPERFRRAMLAYAKASPDYRRRIKRSLIEIENIIEKHGDSTYVACSGGKDSIVLLHLAARIKPTIKVFHWDHGPYLMPRPIEEEIHRIIRSIAPRARLRVETSPVLNSPDARWDYMRWYRSFHGRLEQLRKEGWSVALLGLRREESITRSFKAKAMCRRGNHGLECYPLREWTWRDIWAYIMEHNLPYPSTYDLYCPLLGWDKCRLVTFHDEEFKHLGTNIDGVLMWRYKNT